jgi:hypothetical protein
MENNKKLWTVSCLCLPAGAGREGITATHVDGEKVLPVQEIEQRLADLEQARYRIAALETAMTEAGLDFGYPWEDNEVCPDCGDTGIGLLGIHEWVEYGIDSEGDPYPTHQVQEEYGTPCPTCGKEAETEQTE